MKLPNELIIKIINYSDTNTLLKLKNIEEFNIFNKDINKIIYKNSIMEWKYIQYEYIKNTLKNKIFEDMRIIHILTFGYGEFKQVIIKCTFDNYKVYFDNYWNNEIHNIFDSADFNEIKIDKIIIELKKGLQQLRIKYTNYFYRFPTNALCKVYFDEKF